MDTNKTLKNSSNNKNNKINKINKSNGNIETIKNINGFPYNKISTSTNNYNNSLNIEQQQLQLSGSSIIKITYVDNDDRKIVITPNIEIDKDITNTIPFILLDKTLLENMKIDNKKYLLIMYDIDDAEGIFVHMIVLYIKDNINGIMKVYYIPPTPPSGTHNYIFDFIEIIELDEDMKIYLSSLNIQRTIHNITELYYKLKLKKENILNTNNMLVDA